MRHLSLQYLSTEVRRNRTLKPTTELNQRRTKVGHTDHLGSSSFISEASGEACQFLAYLPFGEQWVDQHDSYDTPYKFSGKELDTETGYNYFGARYYDSGLSVWLSVDPKSDKFPYVSGYSYCLSNPGKFFDPDGKIIHLVGTDAARAFNSYLLSFDGVDENNLMEAFSMSSMTNHFYSAKPVTIKQFRNNYQDNTGVKLKGKQLQKAYRVHQAMASTQTLEIEILTSPDAPRDYAYQTGEGKKGTEFVDFLEGYKPSNNPSEQRDMFVNSVKKGESSSEFNSSFKGIDALISGRDWKLLDNPDKNQQYNWGTAVINGNTANTLSQKISAVEDIIDKVPIK